MGSNRTGQRIGPGGNIAAQRQRCLQTGKNHPAIVDIQPLECCVIDQQASQPPVYQLWVRHGIASRHPLRCHHQWQRQRSPVKARTAVLHQPAHGNAAGHQLRHIDTVLDHEIIKITAEIGEKFCTFKAEHISAQQISIAQGHHYPCTVDRIVSQIDHAAAAQVNRAGYSCSAPFDHAVLKREVARQRQCLAQRTTDQRFII